MSRRLRVSVIGRARSCQVWIRTRCWVSRSLFLRHGITAFGIFTVYVFLLPLLGYRVATVLFVGALQGTLDPPRTARAAAVVVACALGCMLVTYYLFEAYLNVLLPRGRLTGF